MAYTINTKASDSIYDGAYAQEITKKKILDYLEKVNKFCIDKKITSSIQNMLTYKSNIIGIGPSWALACDAPIILKAFSKSFNTYRLSLDSDFREDFVDQTDLYKAKIEVFKNNDMYIWLKKILKKDIMNKPELNY